MRILHVLHHSWPFLDGYAVRSQNIVAFQRQLGLEVAVVTSAQHEMQLGRRSQPGGLVEYKEHVPYYRTDLRATPSWTLALKTPFVREAFLMRLLRATITRAVRQGGVDLIHAHSPALCGYPALAVARQYGIPLVYEVRAFWEDGIIERGGSPLAWAKHRIGKTLETGIFRRADAVVAISKHMAEDIASRGISLRKVSVVPNGVDATKFQVARDDRLADRLGLERGRVIGFIGSLYSFEGLDCAIEAMRRVRSKMPTARLVIVGGGEDEPRLRDIVSRASLSNAVILAGKVPHQDVASFYSVMDVVVYPRLRNRTTELVTPLKPLEAMAAGKAVIGSDVGGIREVFNDGQVGLFFPPGDSDALAQAIIQLLQDPERRAHNAATGKEYATRQRDWESLIHLYPDIYERVLRQGRPAAVPLVHGHS